MPNAEKLPPQLRLFTERLPYRPYATDELVDGLRILPRAHARSKKHIQYDPPAWRGWLIFDVDYGGGAHAWADTDLPPPTWTAQNPVNGHAHVAHALETPVIRTKAAHLAPLRLAGAVDNAYRAALGADFGYACLICKNPEHTAWRVAYPGGGLYELGELAEFVDLSFARGARRLPDYGLGRNCTLFERLRTWGYRAVREHWAPNGYEAWARAVLAKAESYNDFPTPLPYSEVRSIARSVARWVWQRFTPQSFERYVAATHTPAIQARRGRRGGVAAAEKGVSGRPRKYASGAEKQRAYRQREKALRNSLSQISADSGAKKGRKRKQELLPQVLAMREKGMTQQAIAVDLGVPQQTVSRWIKSL